MDLIEGSLAFDGPTKRNTRRESMSFDRGHPFNDERLADEIAADGGRIMTAAEASRLIAEHLEREREAQS